MSRGTIPQTNPEPALSPLMAALARIPSGGIYAIRPSRINVTIHEINALADAGWIMWAGKRRPVLKTPQTLSLWSRTEAGDHALTKALRGGL